jgi:dipeptidyl aminopeptidase/acylaminoacyl peptidase
MAYDIERYLNVRSADGPSLGPNGELAFRYDATGVPQVWRLDEPGAWPEQLTFHDEPVSYVYWSPTRDELLYGMDEGGNERTQIHRLSGDGGESVNLTRTPDAKHYFGGWSHDGDRFAFASNRRDEAAFDVYVQGRDETGDDATLVHETDTYLAVVGWSPSDDRLVLHEAASSRDHDLYVVEVATGDVTHVTPDDEPTTYGSVAWGPDGDALYVTTDRGSDTRYLARLDLASGEHEPVVDGGQWNVENVSIDHETGRIRYARNVDGATDLHVGDLDGTSISEYPTPDLPEGVLSGASFGPDADRLAVSMTGRTVNSNAFVVDVASGDAEQWTRASTAGIDRDSFVPAEHVRFDSFDGLEIPALLSMPEDADGDVPVVVHIHGGPDSQRRPGFHSVIQYLLARGYAVFEPNVRGSSGYGREYAALDDVRNRMDSVRDVKAGVEWLRDRPGIDADRVVAYGGSYGGFMVLSCLTEYPDLWAAGVDLVGISNFVTFLENTGDWRREHRESEYGSLAEDREFLQSISPLTHIEAIRAPLMVIHGENDPRVPVGETRQLIDRASEHVPVESLIFDDEGHGISKLDNRITTYRAIAEFLDEHVGR